MSRSHSTWRCEDCAAPSPKWAGRCPACGHWNSLIEVFEPPPRPESGREPTPPPVPISRVGAGVGERWSTGVGELDRVLGGGLVRGSVTLLGGEPGVGKSTLVLQAAAALARRGRRVLYVAAEESPHQVELRARRLDAVVDGLWLTPEAAVGGVVEAVEAVDADVVVVDSIQTVHDDGVGSTPGTVTQVRECAHRLVRLAKDRGVAVVLVGHVTKDGSLAGPRVLEHVVDTVLAFDGERHHALRLLRAAKHRFGSTSELGLFEMSGAGLVGLPDPSALFLADRRAGVAGSVVVPMLEGQRPLLVEVQALVAQAVAGAPRRSAQGLDPGRLALLQAVLEQRVGLRFGTLDVFVSVVGGVRLVEPGADLGVGLAVASALFGVPLPHGLVACGEVGLGGELRQVAQTPRRLAEAARLGFDLALVPASAPVDVAGIDVVRAATLAEAVALAGLGALDGTGSSFGQTMPHHMAEPLAP